MYSIDFSLTNGLGKPSISIYYSGCDIPNKCKECHNSELWIKRPSKIDYKELHRIIKAYNDFNYSDELIVSFLGGDPLTIYNRESVLEVSMNLKDDFPNVKIIVYSWRMPDEIEERWSKFFDYGVLGQFDIGNLRENYLPASTNQIIYNFKTREILEPIKLK